MAKENTLAGIFTLPLWNGALLSNRTHPVGKISLSLHMCFTIGYFPYMLSQIEKIYLYFTTILQSCLIWCLFYNIYNSHILALHVVRPCLYITQFSEVHWRIMSFCLKSYTFLRQTFSFKTYVCIPRHYRWSYWSLCDFVVSLIDISAYMS